MAAPVTYSITPTPWCVINARVIATPAARLSAAATSGTGGDSWPGAYVDQLDEGLTHAPRGAGDRGDATIES